MAQVAPYIPNEIYETVSSQLRPKDAFTEAWEAGRSEREAARRASVTATAQMVAQLRAHMRAHSISQARLMQFINVPSSGGASRASRRSFARPPPFLPPPFPSASDRVHISDNYHHNFKPLLL